jgi:cysteine desulfurase/selenocysteine lyase
MDPLFFGGQMIKIVTKETATWADVPARFEVGTGKKEGVIGLGAAIDYLEKVRLKNIEKHENELTKYGLKIFKKYEKYIDLYGSKTPIDRLGVFSFNFKDIHSHDTADILNRGKICVRSGHHCAQVLMRCLDVIATARASLYLYNTKEDLEKLAEGFEEVIKVFKLK